MPWRSRVESVLAVLALVVAFKVAHELYRWVAFADERARLRGLSAAIDTVGVQVIRTQMRADSLQGVVESMDRGLDVVRRAVAEYERKSIDGAIPERIYPAYRSRLDAYNLAVRQRNAKLADWHAVVDSNHAVSDRYGEIADSMRAVAMRMGEPYYPVPSPVEVAVRHGIRPRTAPVPPTEWSKEIKENEEGRRN
jgi:hypothetical protein